jgi:CBS domain-containing protein
MICPVCNFDNLPGSEVCARCLQDIAQLDLPAAQDRVQRSLMEDPVSVLRPKTPISVRPDTKIGDAMNTLLANNIGAVLVLEADGTLVGILSERDLLMKVAGREDFEAGRPVREFMTPKPEAVRATDSLAFVLHKMDSGSYRHLPVLAEGKAVGVISVRDMLRHFTRLCNHP